MRFFNDVLIGLKAYKKAFFFVIEHKLYWYAVFPALLMLGIYQAGQWLMSHKFESDVSTMDGIVWYMIQLMLEITVALLFIEFSKYLMVAILSPLLAILSSRTEFLLTKNTYPYNFQQFMWEIKRGVRIVIRNLVWQYSYFLVLMLISSFIWGNFSTSPLFYVTYFIGFYYYGFSFIDYVNERKKITVQDSILLMRKYRGFTIAIGLGFSMMILLPVNLKYLFDWSNFSSAPIDTISHFVVHLFLWMLAAFAPVFTTVASVIGMHDLVDLTNVVENKFIPTDEISDYPEKM